MKTEFDYGRYLASREWALKKNAVRERSGGICERCKNAPATQCHHLTYQRIGHELLTDLQDICRPCHQYESAVSSFDPLHPDTGEVNMNDPTHKGDVAVLMEPILRMASPRARKQAAIHLALTLRMPMDRFFRFLPPGDFQT